MIPIYLKIILASSLLIIFYYLFLESQKNHHFKRFFLLGSLVFSLMIPFLEIPFGTYVIQNTTSIENGNFETGIAENILQSDFSQIGFYLYIGISCLLLLKFIFQIFQILKMKRVSKKLIYKGFKIALIKEDITAYSFWQTIFVNQKKFENHEIHDCVFVHEQAHITQKHSFDILWIEILKAVFWLNPAFYFYRKAMNTNHEFLADDKVLEQVEIKHYQKIIYQEILLQQYSLVQSFKQNNNTKKRFNMMNTSQNKKLKARVLGSVLFTCGVAFLFAEKVKTPIFAKQAISKNALVKTENKTSLSDFKENYQEEKPISTSINKEEIKVSDTVKQNQISLEAVKKGKKVSETKIDDVDIPAEFPGGMSAFRKALAMEMDLTEIGNIGGSITSSALIKVDANGKIVDIKTTGLNNIFNKAVEVAIQKIGNNTTWKPAEKDNKIVASYFKIPVTMQFHGDGSTPPPPSPPTHPRK
ncbi:M56 family metallopeptidase [Soonwooa purpurea]